MIYVLIINNWFGLSENGHRDAGYSSAVSVIRQAFFAHTFMPSWQWARFYGCQGFERGVQFSSGYGRYPNTITGRFAR